MSAKYRRPEDVPTEAIADRLDQLSRTVSDRCKGGDWTAEFTMRIPAQCDRDADIVLYEAARRLRAKLTGSSHTATEKLSAFEQLREFATAEGAPTWAGIVLDELHALATAAYPQGPDDSPKPEHHSRARSSDRHQAGGEGA